MNAASHPQDLWDICEGENAEAAIEACDQVLAGHATDIERCRAFYWRGSAYFRKGDYDRAIADKTRAIELYPDFAVAFCDRGISYMEKGDHDRAIADWTRAIELDPDNVDPLCNRALAYDQTRDHDRAIVDLTCAIELEPDYGVAFFLRGSAYEAKDNPDRGIADLTRAIELDPITRSPSKLADGLTYRRATSTRPSLMRRAL
jgi:tetratricopeptide (TPR) repeat protein